MILGRQYELDVLEKLTNSKKAELLVLYGRRRIGKSALVQHFCKQRLALSFEAVEGENTAYQIQHFTKQLKEQISDPLLEGVSFQDWNGVFSYITSYLDKNKKKVILFFDEFQWQAAGQSRLVALLKYHWDNHWKKRAPLLILCGSIGSFMVKNVLKSKAFYGRATAEMHHNLISPTIIAEMERRCSLYKAPRGYTVERALISVNGADKALRDSKYFHHIVVLEDLFKGRFRS